MVSSVSPRELKPSLPVLATSGNLNGCVAKKETCCHNGGNNIIFHAKTYLSIVKLVTSTWVQFIQAQRVAPACSHLSSHIDYTVSTFSFAACP